MEARKDPTDLAYLNYMFPVMETPSSELRGELSFINSVYSFLINIDLNLLNWILKSLLNKLSKLKNPDPRVESIFSIFSEFKQLCVNYQNATIKSVKNEYKFKLLPTLLVASKLTMSSVKSPILSGEFGKRETKQCFLDLCLQSFRNIDLLNVASFDDLHVSNAGTNITESLFGPSRTEKAEDGVEFKSFGFTIPMADFVSQISSDQKDLKLISYAHNYINENLNKDDDNLNKHTFDQKYLVFKLKYEEFTNEPKDSIIKGIWNSIDLQFSADQLQDKDEETKNSEEDAQLIFITTLNIFEDDDGSIFKSYQSFMKVEEQWYIQSNYIEKSGTYDDMKSKSIFFKYFPLIVIYQTNKGDIYRDLEEEKEIPSSHNQLKGINQNNSSSNLGKNSSMDSFHTCNEPVSEEKVDSESESAKGLEKRNTTRKQEVDTKRRSIEDPPESLDIQSEEDHKETSERFNEEKPLLNSKDMYNSSSLKKSKAGSLSSTNQKPAEKNKNINEHGSSCCGCNIF